jgi:hypothetical protein
LSFGYSWRFDEEKWRKTKRKNTHERQSNTFIHLKKEKKKEKRKDYAHSHLKPVSGIEIEEKFYITPINFNYIYNYSSQFFKILI